jgi:TPR repeat protein
MGTPSYMAPEQAEGRVADARSDVYGLGALLYECLCGVPPFVGTSALTILAAVVERKPKRPRAHSAAIPVELEQLCMRCLEKNPDDRYQTAGELANALESVRLQGTHGGRGRRSAALLLIVGLVFAGLANLDLASSGSAPLQPTTVDAVVSPTGTVARDPLAAEERQGQADASAIEAPVLFYWPRFERLVVPALSSAELKRLETWRAVFFKGSWEGLGHALEEHPSRGTKYPMAVNERLAVAAYLQGWKHGSPRCMGRLGERYLRSPIPDEPLGSLLAGFELTLRAAELGATNAMSRMAKLYGRFGGYLLLWENFVEKDVQVAAGWIYLAEAAGARPNEVRKLRARLKAELPSSIREAERWVAAGERPRTHWTGDDDPYLGAVVASPGPAERVLRALEECAPLSQGVIEVGAGLRHPMKFQVERDQHRNGTAWYTLGKGYDPRRAPVAGFEKDRRSAVFCYLGALKGGSVKALRHLGLTIYDGRDAAKSNRSLGAALLFRAAAIGDNDAQASVATFGDPSGDRRRQERFTNAWSYVNKSADVDSRPGRMPVSQDEAMQWIDEGFRARVAAAPLYSVYQQAPVHSKRLWQLLVVPPLSVTERRDLLTGCGSYPYDFAKRLDPTNTAKSPPRRTGKNVRLAVAAYLLARERGVRRAELHLGELLVRGMASRVSEVRMLGVDLFVGLALSEERLPRQRLAKIYAQDDPNRSWYGLVRADPLAAAGWLAMDLGDLNADEVKTLQEVVGVPLPDAPEDVSALFTRTLLARQRQHRERRGKAR